MTTVDLTTNDAQVLGQLFDPESAAASSTVPTIDPSQPPDAHITSTTLLSTLKSTELRAIRLAESNDLPGARAILTELTVTHPTYASAYNNLAQVLRMLEAPPAEIIAALSKAVGLAAPATMRDPISPSRANLLAQAYTQRGALLYGLFNKAGAGGVAFMGMDKDQLEMAASKDFYEGGRYGNAMGREMAVRTNPYARLCGAIVKEALTREYVGGGEVPCSK